MIMKFDQNSVISTAIGVLAVGLVMYFGRELPLLKQARMGFGG